MNIYKIAYIITVFNKFNVSLSSIIKFEYEQLETFFIRNHNLLSKTTYSKKDKNINDFSRALREIF